MRHDTDVFPAHGQGLMAEQVYSVSHDETPARPKRVRPRPHKKYDSPEEMWAWHWVRMRILLTWAFVSTICSIVVTAGVVIFSELT